MGVEQGMRISMCSVVQRVTPYARRSERDRMTHAFHLSFLYHRLQLCALVRLHELHLIIAECRGPRYALDILAARTEVRRLELVEQDKSKTKQGQQQWETHAHKTPLAYLVPRSESDVRQKHDRRNDSEEKSTNVRPVVNPRQGADHEKHGNLQCQDYQPAVLVLQNLPVLHTRGPRVKRVSE